MRIRAATISAFGILAVSTVFILVSALYSSNRSLIAASIVILSSTGVIFLFTFGRALHTPGTGSGDVFSALQERIRELNLQYGKLQRHCFSLIKTSPTAFFELDGAGRIVSLNPAAERLVSPIKEGAPKLIGRAFAEIISYEDKANLESFFKDALNGKPITPIEVSMPTDGGAVSRVELTSVTAHKEAGPPGIELYARDIAETKRLKNRLKEVKREAELASEELKEKISELEAFALMAVRRELKMKEIREKLQQYSGERTKESVLKEINDITVQEKDLKGA